MLAFSEAYEATSIVEELAYLYLDHAIFDAQRAVIHVLGFHKLWALVPLKMVN